MSKFKTSGFYGGVSSRLEKLKDFPLFFIRLVLAYGFYVTGSVKWANISGVAEWFGQLGIPAPLINAYLAATTEIAGVILLFLGLGTRLISIPLMVVLVVAVVTVHLGNGFEAGNNGFEIPLYYFIMLCVLLVNGAGRFSLDYLIKRKSQRAE